MAGLGRPIPSLLAAAIAAALPSRLPIGDDGAPTYAKVTLPAELSWFTGDVYADNTTSYDPTIYRPTGKAYYIAPNGVDTNSGLTPAAPKKTVANAAAVADCVVVYAAPGDYENAFWGDVSFQSNFRGVICSGPGRARFHAGPLNVSASFVADGANPGAYKWTGAGTVYDCRDEAWPTKYGTWGWMTKATSAAQVASTPGSFYSNGTDLWVRLRGDRAPDARLHVFRQRRCYIGKSNLSLYWEGIDWIGGNVLPNAAGTSIVNHLYNCDIAYPSGADDSGLLSNGANAGFVTYAKNVKTSGGRLDLLSLQGSAKGAYIDCEGFDCPIPGSNNANTMHGTASALLVGGRYYGTSGDVVISVSTGTVVCVGVMSRDCPGASGSDFSSTAGPMWLINCTNSGSISEWTAEGNGTKYGQNNALEPRVINAAINPVVAYTGPGLIPQVPVSPTVSGPVALPAMTVGVPVVVTAAQLMAGATGALFAIDVTATNATVAGDGYGPWTITPTAAGPVALSYTVCGDVGRTVAQTATGVAAAEVAAPAVPAITGVTGTIAHGQTITVTGSGLGQAPTLLRIRGDEGAAGTSVAAAVGMTAHGTTGNEWVFEAGGAMVLDMQTEQPKTVYEVFDAATPDLFVYYELQHFSIGPVNGEGNGQVKELRANEASDGSHSTNLMIGTVWQRESSKQVFLEGNASDLDERPLTVEDAGNWRMTALRGKISGGNAIVSIEQYGGGGNYARTSAPKATAYPGFRQVFLPFYKTEGFAISSRMRNVIVRDGEQGFIVANNADPAFWSTKVEQDAPGAGSTSASVQLDLQRFAPTDQLYLFARNSAGQLSEPHLIYSPPVDTYDPLTDNFGVIRPTFPGGTAVVTVPDYSAAAAAADYVEYHIGIIVDGLDASSADAPIGICLSASAASQYRGHLRIDHVTGAISIRSMVNNTGLTIAASSDVHTNLGARHDWKLLVPKNTGELITLRKASDNSLIGSVVRTSAFDGFWPTKFLYCNTLAAQGGLKGKCPYLRAFATTGGSTAPLFDFRFTEAQSGATSVQSAHDAAVVATIGSGITWGAIPVAGG